MALLGHLDCDRLIDQRLAAVILHLRSHHHVGQSSLGGLRSGGDRKDALGLVRSDSHVGSLQVSDTRGQRKCQSHGTREAVGSRDGALDGELGPSREIPATGHIGLQRRRIVANADNDRSRRRKSVDVLGLGGVVGSGDFLVGSSLGRLDGLVLIGGLLGRGVALDFRGSRVGGSFLGIGSLLGSRRRGGLGCGSRLGRIGGGLVSLGLYGGGGLDRVGQLVVSGGGRGRQEYQPEGYPGASSDEG